MLASSVLTFLAAAMGIIAFILPPVCRGALATEAIWAGLQSVYARRTPLCGNKRLAQKLVVLLDKEVT